MIRFMLFWFVLWRRCDSALTVNNSTLRLQLSAVHCLGSVGYKPLPDDLVALKLQYESKSSDGFQIYQNLPFNCYIALPKFFSDSTKSDGVIIFVQQLTFDNCTGISETKILDGTNTNTKISIGCNSSNELEINIFYNLHSSSYLLVNIPDYKSTFYFIITCTIFNYPLSQQCNRYICYVKCPNSNDFICGLQHPSRYTCVNSDVKCDGVKQCFQTARLTDEDQCTTIKEARLWSSGETPLNFSTTPAQLSSNSTVPNSNIDKVFGEWCSWTSWNVVCSSTSILDCNDPLIQETRNRSCACPLPNPATAQFACRGITLDARTCQNTFNLFNLPIVNMKCCKCTSNWCAWENWQHVSYCDASSNACSNSVELSRQRECQCDVDGKRDVRLNLQSTICSGLGIENSTCSQSTACKYEKEKEKARQFWFTVSWVIGAVFIFTLLFLIMSRYLYKKYRELRSLHDESPPPYVDQNFEVAIDETDVNIFMTESSPTYQYAISNAAFFNEILPDYDLVMENKTVFKVQDVMKTEIAPSLNNEDSAQNSFVNEGGEVVDEAAAPNKEVEELQTE